jgi:dUTPase
MYLKLYVDSDDKELLDKYTEIINDHNLKIMNNMGHIDAGFDLISPETKVLTNSVVNKVDYQVICSAKIIYKVDYHVMNYDKICDKCFYSQEHNTGFYMYPRSSISKSNLRLANNVGIIDAGYRGHLMGMFDVVYCNEETIHKFNRHLQICAPGLIPIIVELVKTREELGKNTSRGDGGFGSTGK